MQIRFPSAPNPVKLALPLLGAGICVHVLFLISLRYGWLNLLFNDSMHRFGPGADFFSIYAAGIKARAGESLYTVGGHVEAVPYAYAYRYAPLIAYTLGFGLSLLPALAAYGLWLVLCELALLRNIRLTLEHAPDKATGYLAASLWLLFSPYYLELYVGQFTFLTASLVFWAYLAWLPRPSAKPSSRLRSWLGDGLFGLSVWLKLMPVLYLPIALLRGRWKSALAVIVVLAVSSWLYFAHHPGEWAVFQRTNGNPIPSWHAGNQGFMALVYGLTGERPAAFLPIYYLVLTVIGSLLLWLAFHTWQARGNTRMVEADAGAAANPAPLFESRLLLLYSACSAAYLLVYKDVWEHHYLLLLPPLVLLALRKAPVALWLPSFLIAALPTLFALYDVHGLGFNEDPQRYWRPAVSLLQHGWKPLSALWLLAGVAWQSLPGFAKADGSRRPARIRRRFAVSLMTLPWIVGGVLLARWAGGAIAQQRRSVVEQVWAPPIFQMQSQPNTCGPAALAAVCRHYGIPAEEEEIARRAGTTKAGTSMLGLQYAAQEKGLTALGRRVTLEDLKQSPLPCILYFHPGHFAVLTGVHNDRFILADPSRGQQVWTAQQLAYFWRGELLAIGPAEQAPGHP